MWPNMASSASMETHARPALAGSVTAVLSLRGRIGEKRRHPATIAALRQPEAGGSARLGLGLRAAAKKDQLTISLSQAGQWSLPYDRIRVVLPVNEQRPLQLQSNGVPLWRADPTRRLANVAVAW